MLKNKTDVVLISSPIVLYRNKRDRRENFIADGDEKSFYPMNILYLAAYLESKGYSAEVVDVGGEEINLDEVRKRVDKLKPMIVGISATTHSIQSAVVLARELKKRGRMVGLGGVHLACDPDFFKRFRVFDFGVIGDGEIVLTRLAEKYKKGESIKGLWPGERIEDLDTIPFPAREKIDYRRYQLHKVAGGEPPAAGILASRGCPYNCIFCSIPARAKKVRWRSAKNVVDEMAKIYDECRGNYSFADDCFTFNREWVINLCDEVIRRGLTTRWIASTRADMIDLEMAKKMRKAGCRELYFGVESGNERIRNKIIGKNLSDKQIKNAVEVCRKAGILSNLFLMVGFPTETKKEMWDTIRIGGRVKADIVGIHVTSPLPGSRLFIDAVERGILPKDIIDQIASGKRGRQWRGSYPLYVPEGESLATLIWVKRLTYILFYLSPFWWWRRFLVWLKMPERFREDLALFKIAGYVFLTGGTKGQLS